MTVYWDSIKINDENYEKLDENSKVKRKNKKPKKKHLKSWRRPTFPPGDPAVLSAMGSLTSRFEMELGMTSSL